MVLSGSTVDGREFWFFFLISFASWTKLDLFSLPDDISWVLWFFGCSFEAWILIKWVKIFLSLLLLCGRMPVVSSIFCMGVDLIAPVMIRSA